MIENFMAYDPWANVTSRNGIPGDELVSMLQKSIRRNNVENALGAAYEMYITSQQFEDKMWRRLLAISVEDIGFGDVHAPELVYTLYKMRQEFPYADGDRALFFVQAIRYMCRQEKERTSDLMKNVMRRKFAHGDIPQVPDYAYDVHTVKGRAMGRDEAHFLSEASRVEPALQDTALEKIHQACLEYIKADAERTEKAEVEPFQHNRWQF